jgi:galactokinase
VPTRRPAASLAADPDALIAEFAARDPVAAANPGRIRVAFAPGRVNLMGEHTDYNDGLVLPCAIDLGISIAFLPTEDRRVELTLVESGTTERLDLDAIGQRRGSWIDYVAGTAVKLAERDLTVSGFRGLLAADLPAGAGLSSSAALELAAAFALSGGAPPLLEPMALAQAAQAAENEYVGVNCGLMDQFAVTFGQARAALLLDCRSLDHRVVPMPLEGVALLVCYSGSPRRLESSAYNARRAECEQAVAAIASREQAVRTLRDVTPAMLDRLRDRLEPVLMARAEHVVTENARVEATVAAFEAGDVATAGQLFYESHASLRDRYEVSSAELDALVEIAAATPGVLGARLTGAGFGGSTITLVRRDAVSRLRQAITRRYSARTRLGSRVFEVSPAAGARLVR